MPVPSEAFRVGDVYIDYFPEQVMFHYVHDTGKIFRRFYGDRHETEVPHSSDLFREAQQIGVVTTAERYNTFDKDVLLR